MRRTTILGYNLQKQSARRGLVIAVYALLTLLLVAGWFLDRLQTTGLYIYFAAFLVNYFVFGGYGPSGLIKPFSGKAAHNPPMPSSLIELELRMAGATIEPNPDDYRNDERETARRDRVHYQAYQAIVVLFCPIWLIAMWQNRPPHFVQPALLPALLYVLVLPIILLAITLPQAILLWTEPDLEPDPAEPSAQTAVKLIP